MSEEMTLDAYWSALVTAAMLGTDRRDPPAPPHGPIADLVADAQRPDGASRLLAAVAAVAAARRAAFLPGRVAEPLRPPPRRDPDIDRPWCSPAAVATWRQVVADWPVLEDEWVLTVVEQGLTIAPDALVELLGRHRSDVVRRARVMLAAGPVGSWLVEHLPELAPRSGRAAPAEAVTSLPELPIPPDLAELLTRDAHTVSTVLAEGYATGAFGPPDRAVLVNLVARCRPAVLPEVAAALHRTGVGHALALADLARLRHRMLVELDVTP